MSALLPTWNGHALIGASTGRDPMSTRVSWMEFEFSTLKESTRLGTATSCKALPTKSSNRSRKPSKRRNQKTNDFPEAHKEINYIFGGLDSYESKRK
jgi:hypothetical protein